MGVYLERVEPEADLKIRSFVDEGHVFVHPHWHKEIEIIYVKKGTINIGVNDQPIQLTEGEIYIVNAGEVHYFFASPDSERVILIFDPTLFKEVEIGKKIGLNLKSHLSKILNSSADWTEDLSERVRAILWQIYMECQERKIGYLYAIKSKMFELILLMYREMPQKIESEGLVNVLTYTEQKEILGKLDLIFDYVDLHYKETIMLEEIADYIGFSQFYFTKFFKKNTGMTFVTFLNCYRLSKAKWLLTNQNLPMSDVAYEAGFQSIKTFYRLFKEDTKMSPLQYQKQYFKVLESKG